MDYRTDRRRLAASFLLLCALAAAGTYLGGPAQPAREAGALPWLRPAAMGQEPSAEAEEPVTSASLCPLHLPDRIAAAVCW